MATEIKGKTKTDSTKASPKNNPQTITAAYKKAELRKQAPCGGFHALNISSFQSLLCAFLRLFRCIGIGNGRLQPSLHIAGVLFAARELARVAAFVDFLQHFLAVLLGLF